jgi:RecB family exonuclease
VPRRLFSCTPTRLLTWSDCPRRYRFAYVDRPAPPKGPPWAHNAFGASVHNALRSWFDLPPEQRTAGAVDGLLDRTWVRDGYRDEEQQTQARDRARAMVGAYVAGLDPASEPRGVERTAAVRTHRLALRGRVDRIDERPAPAGGSELVVVDYKTGRRAPDLDEVRGSLALALYAKAVGSTLRAPCTQVELHHLPTATVVAWRHDEESLARHVRRAERIADEAQAADEARAAAGVTTVGDDAREPGPALDVLYPPSPGARCGWCDFRRSCPEGQAVARAVEPWAGLDRGPGGEATGGEKVDE